MQISAREEGQVRVVSASGSIDALTAGDVETFLDEQLKAGGDKLVFDLSELEFMSSAGLRTLLVISKQSRKLGGDLRLVKGSQPVQKVLDMAGLTGVIETFPSVDEAVASFGAA